MKKLVCVLLVVILALARGKGANAARNRNRKWTIKVELDAAPITVKNFVAGRLYDGLTF